MAEHIVNQILDHGSSRATSHDYHNSCHANRQALTVALDALRKIRLNHPCDLHDRIAAFAIEDIIDPRETRPYLCQFIDALQGRLKTQLGPKAKAGVRP